MTCKPHDHLHCLELFGKLSEYIDQEMGADQRREIETHVAECLACLACLQTLRQTVALCKKIAPRPVPPVFSRRLHSVVQNLHRPRQS